MIKYAFHSNEKIKNIYTIVLKKFKALSYMIMLKNKDYIKYKVFGGIFNKYENFLQLLL